MVDIDMAQIEAEIAAQTPATPPENPTYVNPFTGQTETIYVEPVESPMPTTEDSISRPVGVDSGYRPEPYPESALAAYQAEETMASGGGLTEGQVKLAAEYYKDTGDTTKLATIQDYYTNMPGGDLSSRVSRAIASGAVSPGVAPYVTDQGVDILGAIKAGRENDLVWLGVSDNQIIEAKKAGIELNNWVASLPKEYQDIYKEEGYNKLVSSIEDNQVNLIKTSIQLADGTYITKTDWATLPDKYKQIGLKQGYEAMSSALDSDLGKLKEYTDSKGNIDIAKYLKTTNDKQTLVNLGIPDTDIKSAEDYNKATSPSGIAKEIGLSMIPVYGTIRYYDQAKEGGLTAGEVALLSLSAISDIAMFIPGVGAIAAGARASKELSVGGKLAAAARAGGRVALAEVKSPYTMVRHPVATTKAAYSSIETLLFPRHLPIASAEIAFTTVRIPISATTEDIAEVSKLRQVVTQAAIEGKTAETTIGGTKVVLTPTMLQKVVAPVAVHTTPDIRPYLNGAIVKEGAEGGLFIAPNLHTRFALATAFGKMPEGGLKGALIIRDSEVLKAITPSNKIYRGTAEIEAMVKPGTVLPAPSQILFTRDANDNLLRLLVIGKPFSPTQVSKLKLLGSLDTVKQIFTPTMKISRTDKLASKSIDELSILAKEQNKLLEELKLAKQSKNEEAVAKIKKRLLQLESDTTKLDTKVRVLYSRGRLIGRPNLALAQYANSGILENWDKTSRVRAPDANRGEPYRTNIRIGRSIATRLPDIRIDNIARPRIPSRYTPPVVAAPRVSRVNINNRVITPTGIRPEIHPQYIAPPRVTVSRSQGKGKLPKITQPKQPTLPNAGSTTNNKRYEGAIAWQQGALLRKGKVEPVWKVWRKPYEQNDLDTMFQSELPTGVKTVTGVESAYKTVQLFQGTQVPTESQVVDIGAFTVRVKHPTPSPGGTGKIQFARDTKHNRARKVRIVRPEKKSANNHTITVMR